MSLVAVDPMIHSLRLQQMAPWLGGVIRQSITEEIHHFLNLTVRSVFLYRIGDGEVRLLEKPGFRIRETFNDSSEPEPEGAFIYREEFIRANMYRDFFARVLAGSSAAMDMLVAIDVNDVPVAQTDAPVFAFQKPAGGNTLLIPDIDFLHANFYIPSDYVDGISYSDKISWAVFAGSTTGGRTITADDVRRLAIPRLRSGVFFRGSQQVDFRLPRIVQCESAEVVAMVADLGVNAEPCSWQQQFRYRFILSMDGNGATCSRVVVGLLSHSALVRYDSPHLLYYFGALVPWRHYIPISRDEDVPSIVEAERRHPLLFAQIAAEGQSFARRYLGRAGVCNYAEAFLSFYASCLSNAPARRPGITEESLARPHPLVELGAHIQGIGDVWGWPGEWVGEHGSGRAIEAIAVVPTGIPGEAVSCRVVLADGNLSNVTEFGAFCGTRGCDRPLRGFQLQLRPDWERTLACSYSGRFSDGTCIGPLQAGELCQAPSGATLEAFYVRIDEITAGDRDRGPTLLVVQ